MTGDLYQRLCPEVSQSQEDVEFRAWMKANRKNFQTFIKNEETGELQPKYSLAEISEYALMNGFSRYVVTRHLSHIFDALAGSHVEHRAAQRVYLFECAVEKCDELKAKSSGAEVIDLADLWKDVAEYQTGEAA